MDVKVINEFGLEDVKIYEEDILRARSYTFPSLDLHQNSYIYIMSIMLRCI